MNFDFPLTLFSGVALKWEIRWFNEILRFLEPKISFLMTTKSAKYCHRMYFRLILFPILSANKGKKNTLTHTEIRTNMRTVIQMPYYCGEIWGMYWVLTDLLDRWSGWLQRCLKDTVAVCSWGRGDRWLDEGDQGWAQDAADVSIYKYFQSSIRHVFNK